MSKKYLTLFFILSIIIGVGRYVPVKAQSISELQQKISENNDVIKKLEQEIAQYKNELSKTSAEAKNLQSSVQVLDLNSKKLGADLAVTENKIGSTNLSIRKLDLEITDKEAKILRNQEVLRKTLQKIQQEESQSLLEVMLLYPDISEFWKEIDTTQQLQTSVREYVGELKGLKQTLVTNKTEKVTAKTQLEQLKAQLADQRKIIEANKAEKNRLLALTKNKESNYKQIIADREARKKAFEQELLNYESKLKLAIDPKSIPTARKGVLAWPVDNPIVTQEFGHTEFSKTVTVYNGNGHNGIDLGLPIGTPIKSAAPGSVMGTGDTDTACPGASYGKWVMVKHDNGLSSLYAHLSVIKVSGGQRVETGDVLGYSGVTGYATGPHLHFTVFASQGVQIISRPSKACGGAVYTMPVADLRAYLNPLSYL